MPRNYKKVKPHIPKTSISSLRNLNQYRKRLISPKAAKEEIAKYLLREGGFIITAAYHTRGFNNRTWNLHDSYVAVVFVDGEIYDKPRFVGDAESDTPDPKTLTTGREEAEEFVELMKDEVPSEGVQLIIGAAMYYSGIVESRGYQVLAQIETELADILRRGMTAVKYLAHVRLDEICESSIYREWVKGDGLGSMQIVNK